MNKDSYKEALFKIRRHRRQGRTDGLLTGLFVLANGIGLTVVGAGYLIDDRQYCARDLLCEMTSGAREAVRAQRPEDNRFIQLAIATGGVLVAGNLAYLAAGKSKSITR